MQIASCGKRTPLLWLALLVGLAGCDRSSDQAESAPDARPSTGQPTPGLAISVRPASTVGANSQAAPAPDASEPSDDRGDPVDGKGSGAADAANRLDQLEAAIADLDCSRLQLAQLRPMGGFELRGHVPTAELASDLVAASQRLVGEDIRVTGNLMILPPPMCAVLEAVEAMGLRHSDDQWNDPLAVGVQAWADMPRAIDGQAQVFSFQAPEYDAHIYVDYFDGDGNVLHLVPSNFWVENQFGSEAVFDIGGAEPGPRLVVSPPLGLDIVLVIASTEPIYAGIRPSLEDARRYLAWLHGRVLAQREEHPDFRGEWVFMLMLTEAG